MDHEHDRRQLDRLTFFSDAVFAIAMTLLVVEVRLPHLPRVDNALLSQALATLLPNYIGFVVSFLVVGRFWVAHHNVFALLKATSPRLVWGNLLFLMVVAFMPFPTAVMSEYVQLRAAVGLYTGWLALIGLTNRAVIMTALGDPRLVRHDVDPATIARHRRDSVIPLLIGLLAFALGMIQPLLAIAGLMVGSPAIGWLVRRRPLPPPPPPPSPPRT